MSTESREPQGPNVDEVLAEIESRADSDGRIQFVQFASAMDAAVTDAHLQLNDARVHDDTADWTVMNAITDRAMLALVEAALIGKLMSSFVAANKPAEFGG